MNHSHSHSLQSSAKRRKRRERRLEPYSAQNNASKASKYFSRVSLSPSRSIQSIDRSLNQTERDQTTMSPPSSSFLSLSIDRTSRQTNHEKTPNGRRNFSVECVFSLSFLCLFWRLSRDKKARKWRVKVQLWPGKQRKTQGTKHVTK